MEKHKPLRITFQAIILISVLLYGFIVFSDVPVPKSSWINGDFIKSLILLTVSYIGLIYIMVRVCFKNVKKWEIILYNVLNVVFVIVIYVQIFQLLIEIQDMFQNHNPYNSKTQWDNYINYDEEYEYIALPAGVGLFVYGIPNAIMSLVFGIISIVLFIKKQADNTISNSQEPKQTNNILEINQSNSQKFKINNNVMYCKYCGKQLDIEGKFCKYCGKEIK